MAYRHVVVSQAARIRTIKDQLIVEIDERHSLPIEDINAIVLESQQITISVASLAKLAEAGVAVFVCDEKHLPNGVLLPINSYSRQLRMLRLQADLPKVTAKHIWQYIVTAKIRNQAKCLELTRCENYSKLLSLSKKVKSGDSTNVEAQAASIYFRMLFGSHFRRREDSTINACLNYGYAIMRGMIAKNLVMYGLEPSWGIFHHSELNNFNLADDLLEPFRPIIDLIVAKNTWGTALDLTTEAKRELYNSLNMSTYSGGQIHSVAYAIERTVQSLSRCLNDPSQQLVLPELIEPRLHVYE